ncbi:thioredoxin family protein [Larkinella soli]|uniref:thioredoxin family protein n=1 Tax=Larkinella soli TaxID=1770527 RepID=UPI000FFB80CB|nr:thioredoxin family protein [Larkinella soli]
MNTRLYIALLAVLAITAAFAFIGLPAPVDQARTYAIGDFVNDFRLKNVDGRMVALNDYRNGQGVVIVFTTNHCPFAKAYEERIIALDRKYAPQGFPLVAIQPNDPTAYVEDSFENMQVRAKEKGYSFPYLVDESQAVAQAFGASRTPQAYVLKRTGDRFRVEYAGMIDDSPQDPAGVKRRFVEEAVGNLLGGRPVVTSTTRPIGCAIKWKSI